MAFCKECGADLQGGKFCPNCGASAQDLLVQQRESALSASATLRQASMAECNRMIAYFSEKTKTWNDYDRATELVGQGRSYGHILLLLASIIWFALGVLVSYLARNASLDETRIVLAYLVLIGFLLLLFFLPAALLMWGFIALNKRSKKKYAELCCLHSVLAADIVEHYEAYGYCHVGLPYTRTEVLNKISENLDLGRCTTIEDAVNIMLDDEYKAQMQQQAKAILAAAERAAEAAEDAALASKASLLLNLSDRF